MFKLTRLFRLFAALAFAAAGTAAHACVPISSVPYTITQAGNYCLTADLSIALYSGAAIDINSSYVEIDFQGHKITNTVSPSVLGTAGVRLMNWAHSTTVTIHNGSLDWFYDGITNASLGTNVQANDLTIDNMAISYSRSSGIYLQGTNVRITNNTIKSVNGSSSAEGIYLTDRAHPNPNPNMTASNRAVVQGNKILGIQAAGKTADGLPDQSNALGIYVGGFPDILVSDNAIDGVMVRKAGLDGSISIGIWVEQMVDPFRLGGLLVQDNSVRNSAIYKINAKPGTMGIAVTLPGDHAIVTGSVIDGMDTGIFANNAASPDRLPVLLLNNQIANAAWTQINGGITLPQ